MPTARRSLRYASVYLVAVALLLTSGAVAMAQPVDPPGDPDADGIIDIGGDYNEGKPIPVQPLEDQARRPQSLRQQPPEVGDTREWLALDDFNGVAYFKEYTLRGIGDNIEVWVASGVADPTPEEPGDESTGTEFLPDDCRNDRTQITDEQVAALVAEFDGNIYPLESEAFSVPPARDGSDSSAPGFGLPADYWSGDGERIVTLIDNVRDDNFYDYDNSQGLSYIAGFFFSLFNEIHDRNIMSIDAFDWLHRTGPNPPNEPTDDLCTNATARPYLYEGVFAHEYQHLLEYYEDPDETTWVNEGLSDWAQTLTGYVDPSVPITEVGYDSHIQCFLGYLNQETDANPIPREEGGPENSLTVWQDQGDDEILCDYGATYTMMELLAHRYGIGLMSALHREDAGGLVGLQTVLDSQGTGATTRDLIHDWAAMVTLDGVLDDNGGSLQGGDASDYTVDTLDASINWDNPEAYSTAGAPANGSDYVRLRDASGDYLTGGQLRSVSFDGAAALAPDPVEWTVEPDPPDRTGDAALYSGMGNNQDKTIVTEVNVPADDPTLTFETWFDIEYGWDYGFVQVSTDGGATYTSVGNDHTTDYTDPGAIPTVQANVPGFSGVSAPEGAAPEGEPQWITTQFDLSAYAGQDILLSFRYVTDPAVENPGWYVDDIDVGGTLISDGSSLDGFRSATQVRPTPVEGFTVQLVSYADDGRHARIAQLPLDGSFDGALDRGFLRRNVHPQADVIAAIVMYDDSTGQVSKYAPYELTANGTTQPGGS